MNQMLLFFFVFFHQNCIFVIGLSCKIILQTELNLFFNERCITHSFILSYCLSQQNEQLCILLTSLFL